MIAQTTRGDVAVNCRFASETDKVSCTGGSSLDLSTFLQGLVASHLAGVLVAHEPESTPELVKLAGHTDALIVACSETVKAVAWRFARRSSLVDVDDMYSIGMLEICEAVAAGRMANAANPMGYLVGVARFAMCEEWRRVHRWSTESLDAPLSSSHESTFCLADILPSPAAPIASKRSRAVHDALDHLTALQRAVLRRRYGFPGYGASTSRETAASLRTTVNAVKSANYRGLKNLRRDIKLCKALGVGIAHEQRRRLWAI